ncbi:MAG TPA: DNA polymerase III subunit beta [Candidatus Woesebacteria bacterium]|nr:DNA polymerase III subunit beta [Candidatus Woesebacteria bacterium]HNS94744.1 DNA polymerase III subunit beta [Candidatus Woesebacteria bacterium]
MNKNLLSTPELIRVTNNAIRVVAGARIQNENIGVFFQILEGQFVVLGLHPTRMYRDKILFSEINHENTPYMSVDMKKMLEFLQNVFSPQVAVSVNESNTLVIVSENTSATFPVSIRNTLPEQKEVQGDVVRVSTNLVKTALSQVFFSTSSDMSRPVLSSARICGGVDNKVMFITTDGFRLSMVQTAFASPLTKDVQAPASLLRDVFGFILNEKEDADIVLHTDGTMSIKQGSTTVTTKLVEGDFPPYEKVLVKIFQKGVVLSKKQMTHAIKSMAVFARDHSNIVVFDINPEQLSVRPKKEAGQNTKSHVPILTAHGDLENFSIAFNQKYVLDFLSSVEDENITIRFNRSDSPTLFLSGSLGQEDSHEGVFFQHIIMPVRLQE